MNNDWANSREVNEGYFQKLNSAAQFLPFSFSVNILMLIALSYCCWHNRELEQQLVEFRTGKRVMQVPVYKDRIVVKEVPAAYPDCDPDIVSRAKVLIDSEWTTGGRLDEEAAGLRKKDFQELLQLPLKERLEAHRQLKVD